MCIAWATANSQLDWKTSHGVGAMPLVLLSPQREVTAASACRRLQQRLRTLCCPHAETSRCRFMRCCSSSVYSFFFFKSATRCSCWHCAQIGRQGNGNVSGDVIKLFMRATAHALQDASTRDPRALSGTCAHCPAHTQQHTHTHTCTPAHTPPTPPPQHPHTTHTHEVAQRSVAQCVMVRAHLCKSQASRCVSSCADGLIGMVFIPLFAAAPPRWAGSWERLRTCWSPTASNASGSAPNQRTCRSSRTSVASRAAVEPFASRVAWFHADGRREAGETDGMYDAKGPQGVPRGGQGGAADSGAARTKAACRGNRAEGDEEARETTACRGCPFRLHQCPLLPIPASCSTLSFSFPGK